MLRKEKGGQTNLAMDIGRQSRKRRMPVPALLLPNKEDSTSLKEEKKIKQEKKEKHHYQMGERQSTSNENRQKFICISF